MDNENCNALAEVLRRLPAEQKYADLASEAYSAIGQLDPAYFKLDSYMNLKELSQMPNKFSLTVPGSPEHHITTAAHIYRCVLREPVLSMVYGEEELSWIVNVACDEVVCGLVSQAETGELVPTSEWKKRLALIIKPRSELNESQVVIVCAVCTHCASVSLAVTRCLTLASPTHPRQTLMCGFSTSSTTTRSRTCRIGECQPQTENLKGDRR